MPAQEVTDRLIERVIPITGDHVIGTGDINEFGPWNKAEEVFDTVETDDVALLAAKQERWNAQ